MVAKPPNEQLNWSAYSPLRLHCVATLAQTALAPYAAQLTWC